jgi:hypothetical protein
VNGGNGGRDMVISMLQEIAGECSAIAPRVDGALFIGR